MATDVVVDVPNSALVLARWLPMAMVESAFVSVVLMIVVAAERHRILLVIPNGVECAEAKSPTAFEAVGPTGATTKTLYPASSARHDLPNDIDTGEAEGVGCGSRRYFSVTPLWKHDRGSLLIRCICKNHTLSWHTA